MAKLSGLNVNLEEDEPDAEPDGETPALPVFSSTYDHTRSACHPYFPFSDSDSDSGSVVFSDSRPDPNRSVLDFFDRQSYEFNIAEEFDPDQGPGLSGVGDFNLFGFEDAGEEVLGLGSGIRSGSGSGLHEGNSGGGLRVTGFDSDSDYEDGVFDLDSSDNGNREHDSGRLEDESGLPTSWDSFFAEENLAADEELEWEVQNAVNGTYDPVTVDLFDRLEEGISASSRIPSGDDHEHDLDWEVLLAFNNVVNYIEQAEGIDVHADSDPDYYLYLAASDDYAVNYGDYDAIFRQVFDSESAIRGSPPASKRVVEGLPVVELTVEELSKGSIVCAVCKDEIIVEEKVRKLPCSHYYHGECIIPWLGIRNTCPVCRFELPTDDPEYERNRRRQRGGGGLARESRVRYDSDLQLFA